MTRKAKPGAGTNLLSPQLEVKIPASLQSGKQAVLDLPVLIHVARMVAQFLLEMRDAEYERRNGDQLKGMTMALAACIDLTNLLPHQLADDFTNHAQLCLPLELLRYAISDSKEGRADALLAQPEAHNRRHSSYFRLLRRAEIVATINDLRKSGLPLNQSASRVARHLHTKEFGSAVEARQLINFRKEITRPENAALREFVKGFAQELKTASPVDAGARLEQMAYVLRLLRTQDGNF